MSRDLGGEVGSKELYARKLWADFFVPYCQAKVRNLKNTVWKRPFELFGGDWVLNVL